LNFLSATTQLNLISLSAVDNLLFSTWQLELALAQAADSREER